MVPGTTGQGADQAGHAFGTHAGDSIGRDFPFQLGRWKSRSIENEQKSANLENHAPS